MPSPTRRRSYNSGNYTATLDVCSRKSRLRRFEARGWAAAAKGKLRELAFPPIWRRAASRRPRCWARGWPARKYANVKVHPTGS